MKLNPIYHNHETYRGVFFIDTVVKKNRPYVRTKVILLDKKDNFKAKAVGVSLMSPKDQYNHRTGRVISFGRGLRALNKFEDPLGYTINGQHTFEEFTKEEIQKIVEIQEKATTHINDLV